MFIDAQKRHEQYPESFEVHHIEDLIAFVEPGDYVKICHQDPGERFWVLVDVVQGTKLQGRVANELVYAPFDFQDPVTFEHRHIYDYLPKDAAEAQFTDNEDDNNLNYYCDTCNEPRR